MSEAATMEKPKQTRNRRVANFGLFQVEQTADVDDAGKEIPGTRRVVLVEVPLPGGLTAAQRRSRAAIKTAVHKAVYDDGIKDYGNKQLVVVDLGEPFNVQFTEVTETRLVPPGK